jgi:hypothetical protein
MVHEKIKVRLPELEELLKEVTSHWEEEDAVHRYYHGSFKVYAIQDCAKRIVAMFEALGDGLELNGDFLSILLRDHRAGIVKPWYGRCSAVSAKCVQHFAVKCSTSQ